MRLEDVIDKPQNFIEEDIQNTTMPSGFDTILAVKTDAGFHVIGMCTNITMNSQRPITQLPELGSNFTFLIADASQNSMNISRLMPIKKQDDGSWIGSLPYEIYSNYPATSGSYDVPVICPDLDYPVFDHPFQVYVIMLKDENKTRSIKSMIEVNDCLFAQYNIGEIVAGKKNIPEAAVIVFGNYVEIASV